MLDVEFEYLKTKPKNPTELRFLIILGLLKKDPRLRLMLKKYIENSPLFSDLEPEFPIF